MKYLLFIAFICTLFLSCSLNENKPGFVEWYRERNIHPESGKLSIEENQLTIKSAPLTIDSIYPSMAGPMNRTLINIQEQSNIPSDELIWITGYEVSVVDAKSDSLLSAGFMCHNNLNILSPDEIPWNLSTLGSDLRLFTLSEGIEAVELPKGFGVPIPASTILNIESQVLNHNIPDLKLLVKHEVTLNYVRDSQVNSPLTPLFVQTVFITKQVKGPAGDFDSPVSREYLSKQHSNEYSYKNSRECLPGEFNRNKDYHPLRDRYGRQYTGHWDVPPGRQVLTSNVTRMLNLPFDTKVHYIAVHLHPYAESLELMDNTAGTVIFNSKAENYRNKKGLKHVSIYSDSRGIELYQDHSYSLISIYDNITQDTLDAMATMTLFMENK